LFARANTRAAPCQPCHHAHHPNGNAAAEPGRALVAAAAALVYRHVQAITNAAFDFNSDTTAVHGDASVADDHPNRQRHKHAADAARGLR